MLGKGVNTFSILIAIIVGKDIAATQRPVADVYAPFQTGLRIEIGIAAAIFAAGTEQVIVEQSSYSAVLKVFDITIHPVQRLRREIQFDHFLAWQGFHYRLRVVIDDVMALFILFQGDRH